MFSMINIAAVALVAVPALGGYVKFDLRSNGRYWWGQSWEHSPKHGSTGDCVCVKGKFPGVWLGIDADSSLMSRDYLDYFCFMGRDLKHNHDMKYDGHFDGKYPIDITIHGSDGLWVDHFDIETQEKYADGKYSWSGGKWRLNKRSYGTDNTKGWCLSQDRWDSFDKYAEHSGCHQTITFNPNGKTTGRGRTRVGYWKDADLLAKTAAKCQALRQGRRRAETEAAAVVPAGLQVVDEESFEEVAVEESLEEVEDDEFLDADPAGETPNDVHSEVDALFVGRLHEAIRTMVRNNDDVTYGQIDALLNSAMLETEHIVERQEHEGEVVEPEVSELDGSAGSNIGSAGTGSNNVSNVKDRLQHLLEESP